MYILGILVLVLSFILVVWHFATRKYLNPYKLTIIIGPKGSGKTSDLTKRAIKAINNGETVYCTEPIPGTYLIDAKSDIGKYHFVRGSTVLVDEAGTVWDKRKYKDFDNYVRDWFKFQRHYGLKVFLYSQDSDIDVKVRTLCDTMYILEKYGRVFSVGKGIYKKITLTESTADTTSNVAHNLAFMPLLSPGSRTFTFIPKYAGVFDTYMRPKLAYKEFKYIEIPDDCKHLYMGYFKRLGQDEYFIEENNEQTNDSDVIKDF